MKTRDGIWILIAALFIAAAAVAADPAPVTDRELKALIAYDLGPDQIDVSGYPSEQQAEYRVFLQRCSVCHTPARAINSPLKSREDWGRFINLMHARFQSRMQGPLWNKKEGRQILDFLVYDSYQRKTLHPDEFAELQKRLAERFEAVQKEKQARQKNTATKPAAPYTGANP